MRRFFDYHPITVAVYMLSVIAVSMFCMNPVLLSLSLTGSLVMMGCCGGGRKVSIHLTALGVFVLTVLINPMVSHAGETVLFIMNDMPITLESFLYGVTAGLMLMSTLYWFSAFSYCMTSDRLLYLLGKLSPKLSLVLSMALSMLPRFIRQANRVQAAQKVLGRYREDSVVDDVRGGVEVFSTVTTWALENGIVTADSMVARGYGSGKRTRFAHFRFRAGDAVLITLTLGLCVLTFFGMTVSPTTFYPHFQVPLTQMTALIGYAAFLILILLPLMIEGKERLKWAYLLSKI